jgi:hypothetical protein
MSPVRPVEPDAYAAFSDITSTVSSKARCLKAQGKASKEIAQ